MTPIRSRRCELRAGIEDGAALIGVIVDVDADWETKVASKFKLCTGTEDVVALIGVDVDVDAI